MKKSLLGLAVLGVLLCTSAYADSPVFPVNFNASVTGNDSTTLVKVEGTKLRISINAPDGSAMKDYSMDVEEGTIAEYPGDLVHKGAEGYDTALGKVMSSLGSFREGLSAAGDSDNLAALDTTIGYLNGLE